MAPRGARGLFHPPPFWPKPDLPSTSSRSWPPGQRPCVLSLPGPLGMDCSGNRPFLGRANSEEGREGSRSCTEGSAGRRVPEWASKLAKTDGGVAQRVSVPGMGGEGTWSLEQEGPEECQASGLCAPSPSLRGLPSGGPGGEQFWRDGQNPAAGDPWGCRHAHATRAGILGATLHPTRPPCPKHCVSRRSSVCKTRAAWRGEESITRGDYSLLG